MEIESPSFTDADLLGFLHEVVKDDRAHLVKRLERASARLGELVARMEQREPGEATHGWDAQEVLAHIAVFSGLYAWLAKEIGTAGATEFDLLGVVSLRDIAGDAMSARPASELLETAQERHRDAAAYLRQASVDQLRRRARVGPWEMSSDEVARLALVAHLERHLRQLEEALGP